MKSLHIILIISAARILSGCTGTNGADSMSSESAALIPDLPARATTVGVPLETDRLRATFADLKQRLTTQPDDLKSWLKLSEVYITEARITGNYGPNHDAALEILDRVLTKTTGPSKRYQDMRSEALTLKALIKLSQHEFADALLLGEEAVKLDPHRAFNFGVLVDAQLELGNYEKAVAMCDKMVGIRPDLRSYSRVSYLREIHGDVDGAKQAMEMAVQAGYPGSEETSWSRIQLGGLNERNGDLVAAQAQYHLALSERPNYPFALAALGRVAGKMKNYTVAEKELNAAIALMPDASFHEELARVYGAQNKTAQRDEAVRNAGLVLAGMAKGGEGHSHQVGLEMARYQLEFGKDLDNALTNAEHEATHRADNIDVELALAAISYAKGDASKASMAMTRAKRTNSKDPYMQCLDGLITVKNGEVEKGKALIAESLKRDPYQNHPFANEARRLMAS